MREIKFREFRKTGGFHYWGVLSDDNFTGPCHPANNHDQFTGLLDKNGVEIYEGDILYCGDDAENPCQVFWCDQSAQWKTSCNESESCSIFEMTEALVEFAPYYSVIGNIHENPELLEKT